jgi:hypothetical protein
MIFRAWRCAQCAARSANPFDIAALVRRHATNSESPEAHMADVPKGERAPSSSCTRVRATMATALMAAAIASLAITSLIHSKRATAQSSLAHPAPSMLTVPLSIPPDSGELGPFAFGHLEFDWDPASGVPGFNSWPPGARSR